MVNNKNFYMLVLLLVLQVSFSSASWAADANTGKKIKAPAFSLPTIVGNVDKCSVGSKSANNKYTVLMFWTTWCPHCGFALKDMEQFFKKYGDKINFCAIAVQEDMNKLLSTVKRRNLTFPIADDVRGTVAYLYAVMGVPTIVVIDKNGYVIDYGFNLRGIMNKLINRIGSKG